MQNANAHQRFVVPTSPRIWFDPHRQSNADTRTAKHYEIIRGLLAFLTSTFFPP